MHSLTRIEGTIQLGLGSVLPIENIDESRVRWLLLPIIVPEQSRPFSIECAGHPRVSVFHTLFNISIVSMYVDDEFSAYPNGDAYAALDVDAALGNTGPGLCSNLKLLRVAWIVRSNVKLGISHVDIQIGEIFEDLRQNGDTGGWSLLCVCRFGCKMSLESNTVNLDTVLLNQLHDSDSSLVLCCSIL